MHKFLKDIGINSEQLPQSWFKDDKRQKEWKQQRKKYGLDERELWNLDLTYCMWTYERLKMFEMTCPQELLNNTIKYKGKTYTVKKCIDIITKTFNDYLNKPIFEYNEKIQSDIEKSHILLGKILHHLWW
jgi:hypothetical protein